MRGPRVSALALLTILAAGGIACGGSVSGNLTYEDRLFDKPFTRNPPAFQGITPTPIRGAVVEVWEVGGVVPLATSFTDDNGNYAVPVAGAVRIFAKLLFYAKTVGETIKVQDTGNAIYVLEGTLTDGNPDGKIDPGAVTAGQDFVALIGADAGAFNIFDCCYSGRVHMTNAGAAVPSLTVYWPTLIGTGYLASTIYIQSWALDPDEFDDAVILHEFGHFVSFKLSKDDSPGGDHYLTTHEDPRLAWSEGWASFYSSLVRNYSYYYDLDDNDGFDGRLADIEDLSAFPLGVESDNEVAVAAALWDIVDNEPGELFDLLNGAFDITVWRVMDNHVRVSADPVTLETFWDGWIAEGLGNLGAVEAIFGARQIEYVEDASENDDARVDATVLWAGGTVHHTYYGAGDVDWTVLYLVDGKQYTIETVNLKNAANTVLELYEPGEVVYVYIHDDRSNDDKSCIIQFTAAHTGAYAVKSYAYANAGALTRYGSYDLRLTTPSPGNGGGGGCFLGRAGRGGRP